MVPVILHLFAPVVQALIRCRLFSGGQRAAAIIKAARQPPTQQGKALTLQWPAAHGLLRLGQLDERLAKQPMGLLDRKPTVLTAQYQLFAHGLSLCSGELFRREACQGVPGLDQRASIAHGGQSAIDVAQATVLLPIMLAHGSADQAYQGASLLDALARLMNAPGALLRG